MFRRVVVGLLAGCRGGGRSAGGGGAGHSLRADTAARGSRLRQRRRRRRADRAAAHAQDGEATSRCSSYRTVPDLPAALDRDGQHLPDREGPAGHHPGPRREADHGLPRPGGHPARVGRRGLLGARAVRDSGPTSASSRSSRARTSRICGRSTTRSTTGRCRRSATQSRDTLVEHNKRPADAYDQGRNVMGRGKGAARSRSTSAVPAASTSPRSSCATSPTPAAAGCGTPFAPNRRTERRTRPSGSRRRARPRTHSSPGLLCRPSRTG